MTRTPSAHKNLAELPVSARATLGSPAALDGTLVRLMEMGMTPGAVIEVTRRAALGDPIEVLVRGTRVCLRRADAAHFPVAGVEAPSAKDRP